MNFEKYFLDVSESIFTLTPEFKEAIVGGFQFEEWSPWMPLPHNYGCRTLVLSRLCCKRLFLNPACHNYQLVNCSIDTLIVGNLNTVFGQGTFVNEVHASTGSLANSLICKSVTATSWANEFTKENLERQGCIVKDRANPFFELDNSLCYVPTDGFISALESNTPYFEYSPGDSLLGPPSVTLSLDKSFAYNVGLRELNLSGWDTKNISSMISMLEGCNSLESVNFGGWDTSDVTHMNFLFAHCPSLKSLDIRDWDTSCLCDLYSAFLRCGSLLELDLSGWDTKNVCNMASIFSCCFNLKSLNISGWNFKNVWDLSEMFNSCRALTGLDLSDWDVGSVAEMGSMFCDCSALSSLNVSHWDVSNVTNMDFMFYKCTSLTSLDLSSWNINNKVNLYSMFKDCTSLRTLNLSGWDISGLRAVREMFFGCSNLVVTVDALHIDDFNALGYNSEVVTFVTK